MKGRVAGHQIIALSEHFKAMPHIEVWIDLASQFQHLITFAVVDAIGGRPLIILCLIPEGPSSLIFFARLVTDLSVQHINSAALRRLKSPKR